MATTHPRAALESLLRDRKLDRTLTTTLPGVPAHEDDVVATGEAGLDVPLLGGLPRGQLSEIAGPRSSGRTSLIAGIVAGVTRRGELAAVIDTLDRWDPAGLAARGADLGRVLWIRGRDVPLTQMSLAPDWEPSRSAAGRRRSHVAQALDRAIKAVSLVLTAGGFGLVVLDLADVPLAVLHGLPFTTWMRLHRMLEGGSTACVILGAEPLARSAGGVSIRLQAHRAASPSRADPASAPPLSFHDGVRASRRPFIGRVNEGAGPCVPAARSNGAPGPCAPAGRWKGGTPAARRFSGLQAEASVVRAHRSGQTMERVELSFGT